MDELRMLGTVLEEPDPSPEAADRSRHRLRQAMRGSVRRPRVRWVVVGAGLTAAATAAAVVITSNPTEPPAHHGPPAATHLSGRQVLLAAATTAERRPAESGTYWYTKKVDKLPGGGKDVSRTWMRRDGQTWISAAPGMVSKMGRRSFIDDVDLTFGQIQKLPTDPDELKSTLLHHFDYPPDPPKKELLTINLLKSLFEAPAPPKVRAAAFRAFAAMPHVKNLGRGSGGYRLLITYVDPETKAKEGTEKIVVDPKAARFHDGDWGGFGDGNVPVLPATITHKWVNTLPDTIVPWKKQIPYIKKLDRKLDQRN